MGESPRNGGSNDSEHHRTFNGWKKSGSSSKPCLITGVSHPAGRVVHRPCRQSPQSWHLKLGGSQEKPSIPTQICSATVLDWYSCPKTTWWELNSCHMMSQNHLVAWKNMEKLGSSGISKSSKESSRQSNHHEDLNRVTVAKPRNTWIILGLLEGKLYIYMCVFPKNQPGSGHTSSRGELKKTIEVKVTKFSFRCRCTKGGHGPKHWSLSTPQFLRQFLFVQKTNRAISKTTKLVGGSATPLKNMIVNWDDYSQYMGK